MVSSTDYLSIAPRNLEELRLLGPFMHRRIAEQLLDKGFPCWASEREKVVFVTTAPEQRVQRIYEQLCLFDEKQYSPVGTRPLDDAEVAEVFESFIVLQGGCPNTTNEDVRCDWEDALSRALGVLLRAQGKIHKGWHSDGHGSLCFVCGRLVTTQQGNLDFHHAYMHVVCFVRSLKDAKAIKM